MNLKIFTYLKIFELVRTNFHPSLILLVFNLHMQSQEAIAGKCTVICISKDNRNPQPTNEELQMADHVFYRTFDVGNCKIADKIDDKIAGVEGIFSLYHICF